MKFLARNHCNVAVIIVLWFWHGIVAAELTQPQQPQRVVSMNLCTDQLAMLVADEGQLISVSSLSLDPHSSSMVEQAQQYHINHGLAEEIYLLQPDLVLASVFSNRITLNMLERLGVAVKVIEPVSNLKQIPERLLEMGEVLDRPQTAEQLLVDFDRQLHWLQQQTTEQLDAALYYANGYTSGEQTLAGQILLAAGFNNIAEKAGYPLGGVLPLEVLAMANPQVLIRSKTYQKSSRAEEILSHPVVKSLRQSNDSGGFSDQDWVCGTPHVLNAIAKMVDLNQAIMGRAQ